MGGPPTDQRTVCSFSSHWFLVISFHAAIQQLNICHPTSVVAPRWWFLSARRGIPGFVSGATGDAAAFQPLARCRSMPSPGHVGSDFEPLEHGGKSKRVQPCRETSHQLTLKMVKTSRGCSLLKSFRVHEANHMRNHKFASSSYFCPFDAIIFHQRVDHEQFCSACVSRKIVHCEGWWKNSYTKNTVL